MLITPTSLSETGFKESTCLHSPPFPYLKNAYIPDFCKALYRNSRVHRLTVDQLHFHSSDFLLNQWYTINLKVVTEMGLPIYNIAKTITCQLLHNNGYCFTKPTHASIEYHLMDKIDVWQTANDGHDSEEHHRLEPNSTMQVQYRILGELDPHQHYYLYFESQQGTKGQPLSLCIGPFSLFEQQKQQPSENRFLYWDETIDTGSLQTFRALPLASSEQFIMLQEIWENGTQGKLWDSALVMIQAVNEMIRLNKHCFDGLDIMDLSAGIGCLGLSIAKNCELYGTHNPPNVVLTDMEEALMLIKDNQKLNYITTKHTQIYPLSWGSDQEISNVMKARQNAFDYILVSDVLYNPKDFPALVATFRQLINLNYQKDLVILMGYKPRGLKKSEEYAFFNACKQHLHIESIDLDNFAKILSKSNASFFSGNQLLKDIGVSLYKITRKHTRNIRGSV